jgi:predicted PurR-regulated permease PerM
MDRELKLPFYAKATLMIVGIYAFLSMMYLGRSIIVPIIFATIIAILLHPLQNYFLKLKLNRIVAILLTISIAVLIVLGLSVFIILQVSRFKAAFPELIAKFDTYFTDVVFWISGFFDISTERISEWLANTKAGLLDKTAPAIGQTLLTIGNLFIVILLIPVYIFMILYYEPILTEFIRRSFDYGYRHKVSLVISEVKMLIQSYLSGLFIEMVIVAALNILALLLLGVDYAVLLGIIGAILNLIPYIGGIIAVALPMMLALVTSDSPWTAIWVLVLYYVIQLIDNNYLVPKIVASKVKINALVSVVVVLAFGALWGIPGMFISIPLTAIVKLISDHIEPLKPFGFLLGDTMPENELTKLATGKKKPVRPGKPQEKGPIDNVVPVILILIFSGFCTKAGAQQDQPLRDSTEIMREPVRDSTIIIQDSVVYRSIDDIYKNDQDSLRYKALQRFSQRTVITRFLHDFIFRPIGNKPSYLRISDEEYFKHKRAQGRYIRRINITTLDPFGYDVADTFAEPDNFIYKAGNSVHRKTKSSVIRNLILFNVNQRYDSVMVKESERLIRSQKYVSNVKLSVSVVHRDSVDVTIRVADSWSLIPSARRTPGKFGIGLADINFNGNGNTLGGTMLWKQPNAANVTHLSYFMPNIRNSHTSINIQYLFSLNRDIHKVMDFSNYFFSPVSYNPRYMFSDNINIIRSIEINRPFYSQFSKWAGGLFVGQMMTTQNYISNDTLRFSHARTNIQDAWVGRSWTLNDRSHDVTTSLVLSARLVRTAVPARSTEAIDANIFNNRLYYFGAVSITSRKYYRDRYVFNYGVVEDIPAGIMAGITIGREYQQKSRFYVGWNAGMGNYFPYGYLGTQLSFGTFRTETGIHQGIFSGRITYFTRLLSFGNWKIRQFIRPSFVFGINNSPADNQPLRIGIKGFESIESQASGLFIMSLQTQSYAPWDIAGFHFGPFFFSHIGILGKDFQRGKHVYSLLGFGVLIKNEYLMFNTFQVSLSFYPFIPDAGTNILRMNAYRTSDYGFRDFEVSKPGIVE